MIGQVFGEWTVIDDALDRVDKSGKHHKRVLVECSCKRTVLEKDVYKLKNGAKMCKQCYLEILPSNGKLFEKNPNKYDLSGKVGVGYTSKGEEFYFDIDDYELIKNYTWFITPRGYVATTLNDRKTDRHLSMHQLICGKNSDHKDRNPRNNTRENLRLCTFADNARNRSLLSNNTTGIMGVGFNSNNKKWIAYIGINGKTKRIGTYENKYDAIVARLKAEKDNWGTEFSPQRHLFQEYNI